MGFDPPVWERYFWAPRVDTTKEMCGHTVNTLIGVLMSFTSLVCLRIGKEFELKVGLIHSFYSIINIVCQKEFGTNYSRHNRTTD